MALSINRRTGCSTVAMLLLVILILALLGYYYIWKVDSTGYTAPAPTSQAPAS